MEQLTTDIFQLTETLITHVKELTDAWPDDQEWSAGMELFDSINKVKELLVEANQVLHVTNPKEN